MEVNTELPPDEVILSMSSGSSRQQQEQAMKSFSTCEEKAQAIRDCLQGNLGNENVDLWQLRQLALLPGGLLSPSLRKSAWAKLTGVSDSVWTTMMNEDKTFNISSSSISDDRLAPEDAQALQQDVRKAVWRPEDVVQQSKATAGNQDSFWFTPLQQTMSSLNSPSNSEPSLLATPTSCFSDNSSNTDEDSSSSHYSASVASFHKHEKNPPSSPVKQLPSEQSTLKQVLVQVVEQSPEHVYHYSPGLVNVAALMLVNAESPTLSSAILSQLAAYSFSHILTNQYSTVVDDMTELLVLLVDYFHLPLNCDLHNIAKHSLTWFTSQRTSSVQMASRLFDAFLVSHPFLPLYFGAATLSHEGALWTVDTMEDIIRTGLSFMEQFPPSELLAMASNRVRLVVPHTPVWALAASAPTDWALLQIQQEEEHIDLPCFPLSPPSTPARRGQQQQQNYSFETTESGGSGEWERLSVVPSASAELYQPMFPELEDKPVDDGVATLETHFYDSYPLAMTAAGLAVGPSKTKAGSSTSTHNTRSWVYRLAFLVAFIITLVGIHLEGPPQLPIASRFSSTRQYIDLIPAMSTAGQSAMVKAAKTSSATAAMQEPDAGEKRYKYMFEGLKSNIREFRSSNSKAILQPFARQIQQLNRFWKRIVSKVARRKDEEQV